MGRFLNLSCILLFAIIVKSEQKSIAETLADKLKTITDIGIDIGEENVDLKIHHVDGGETKDNGLTKPESLKNAYKNSKSLDVQIAQDTFGSTQQNLKQRRDVAYNDQITDITDFEREMQNTEANFDGANERKLNAADRKLLSSSPVYIPCLDKGYVQIDDSTCCKLKYQQDELMYYDDNEPLIHCYDIAIDRESNKHTQIDESKQYHRYSDVHHSKMRSRRDSDKQFDSYSKKQAKNSNVVDTSRVSSPNSSTKKRYNAAKTNSVTKMGYLDGNVQTFGKNDIDSSNARHRRYAIQQKTCKHGYVHVENKCCSYTYQEDEFLYYDYVKSVKCYTP